MYKKIKSVKTNNGPSSKKDTEVSEMIINKIALIISIIGCLNWGLVGLFSFDLVAWISGGPETLLARKIRAENPAPDTEYVLDVTEDGLTVQ